MSTIAEVVAAELTRHEIKDDDSGPLSNGEYGWRCACGAELVAHASEEEQERDWCAHLAEKIEEALEPELQRIAEAGVL